MTLPTTSIAFEPFAPGFDADPAPIYQRLREEEPLHYWAAAPGWLVTRHEDVASVIRDSRFSLNYWDWEHAPPQPPMAERSLFDQLQARGTFQVDGADHTRLRKLVSHALTPRAVDRMRQEVQAITDEVIESHAAGQHEINLYHFADYIPLRVISRFLSIPRDQEAAFRRFGVAVIEASNPVLTTEQRAEVLVGFDEGVAMLEEVIDHRRRHLGEDFLSGLIFAEEEGQRLTQAELISLVQALVAAGSDTTVYAICFAVLDLLQHPDQMQLVLDDPSMTRAAFEESLRYNYVLKVGNAHYCREQLTLCGRTFHKGEMVVPGMIGAQRDPAVFPSPDTFDIRRDLSQSLAFGGGPHYCMGAALARLEGTVAIGTLLRRFPRMQLAGEPSFSPSYIMRAIHDLPVRLGGPS
jgi:cytochrome P450 enzyme